MYLIRAIVAFVLGVLGITVSASGFGYHKLEQYQWRKKFHSCNGLLQSPILINRSEAIHLGMPSLEMIGYHNVLPGYLKLQNNGHSVALSIVQNNTKHSFSSSNPYIFGAMLDNDYQFEGLHFHWGERNNRGSEHILNDVRYPLEMHLIHRNIKYYSVEQALKHDDGLSVLAVLFQLKETRNKALDSILNHLSQIEHEGSSVQMKQPIKLSTFMPMDTDIFYSYKGSLTTPPCSEAVTWIIFPDPVLISFDQIEKFRSLKDSGNLKLADNYRYLQPVGNRKIFLRKPGRRSSDYFFNAAILKRIWFKA